MTRLALLERLKTLQQTPAHQKRDITTVSALLSNEALARHVEHCEVAAGASASRDAAGNKASQARPH